MDTIKDKVIETAEFIKTHTDVSPKIGILTGTGLGESSVSRQSSRSLGNRRSRTVMWCEVGTIIANDMCGARRAAASII